MVEIAEIFHQYGEQYREMYGDQMLPSHWRVMGDLERCRTAELGGHVYTCPECQEQEYHYHSCRNRHCPKCQNGKGQEWLEKQQDLLLPVPYYLVTFTLPDELRAVVRSNQYICYDLLLRTGAEAMQTLARDSRFIGGQIGCVGTLHTWGRNMSYHPHAHFVVPAGGVGADGETWLPAKKNFFLPVKALSRIFRAKFRDGLRKTECFAQVPATVWEKEWVVHCQPVGDGVNALKYLAPYIFRVAISNQRIIKLENDRVTFRYRATDTGQLRTCVLPAIEFIRRFLQHVLPRGFVKVRYYGFLSHSYRRRLAPLRQQLKNHSLEQSAITEATETEPPSPDQSSDDERAGHVVLCPVCGHAMIRQEIAPPRERHPP